MEQFLNTIDNANLWHFARRPLDLDWLVRFWSTEGRLRTLREMVERSITERLRETNPDRSRGDHLDSVTALRAIERIGAAMVFGRRTTLAIPDREGEVISDTSLHLADILPDWAGEDRVRLLTRPVFDPATFGRARFHNNNDGTVRSYLAARWLARLREANFSTAGLFQLLFSKSYGLDVIRPSLNETTAWLCLWDKDVANQMVSLAPALLLDSGDPASLSANIRSAALAALLRELAADDREWPWFDNDKLRRFEQSDLGNAVLLLWPQYRGNREAAQLLMRLVWLCELRECVSVAREIAFDSTADPVLRVFAGRAAVRLMLQVMVNGLAEADRACFEQLGVAKFEQEPDASLAVLYLAAVFSMNPRAATSVFVRSASALDEEAQTALVDRFLTACFGDSISGNIFRQVSAPPADIIEELMLLSFKTYKQVASRRRPTGFVYQTNEADYADQVRGAIFSRFVKTPGPAAYHALRRLERDPNLPVPPARLRALAEQRALEDSEAAPWLPGEAYAFEQTKETAPRTGKDLRSLLLARIEDIQHELLHDDFSQGQTLKTISSEKEVQKWAADRLRLKQGQSFSVDREPHVVYEKEPDVRIRATASDANVAMEIKVAESWSLAELDNALEAQLCGRYLRSDKGRYGVLLLVHQEARSLGWEDKSVGRYLSFPQVVDRLRSRALAISGESHDSPQPEVAVLDVSGV
jgi:hypothetical protein